MCSVVESFFFEMISWAALLVVVWGAFAFGAVYQWAFVPLAVACAMTGLAGLAAGRHRLVPEARWLFTALGAIAVVGILQLIPLPQPQLETFSPATDRFLRAYDLRYAYAATRPDLDLGLPGGALWHTMSIAPTATWRAVGLLAAFALFTLGLLRALSRRSAVRLGKGLVVVGVLLALVGIVQKATLGDQTYVGMRIYGFWKPQNLLGQPFGPFVNKNHFAGWMLMVIPVAFAFAMQAVEESAHRVGSGLRRRLLWLSSPGGSQALTLIFAALVMSLSLVMTRSRSGLACFVVMALVAGTTVGRRTGSRRGSLVVMAGLAAFVLLALVWAGTDTALDRLGSESESVQLRLNIWRVAAAIVRDFPILGSGLDTFGVATLVYQPTGGDIHYQEAHNDYLQILAEGGIVTLAAVIIAVVALARALARRLHETEDSQSHWLRIGAALGLFAIALQATVEFSLQMPGNAALFAVLIALALHAPRTPNREPSTQNPEPAPRTSANVILR